MADSTQDLLVVSYFGGDAASIREQLEEEPWRVRHTRDRASLEVELDRARPHLVIVDRWLLRDEAAACVHLARAVHRVPTLLMATENELRDGVPGFEEPVDGVLAKPLGGEPLREQLRRLAAAGPREADAPPPVETPVETPEGVPACAGEAPPARPRSEESGWERTLGAARLLDEVRETLRRLGEVIRIDSISGLLFRDFFLERAQREIRRAGRYAEPLAAMVIDIDDFKGVNDRFGHEAGNDVLAALGGILSDAIRRDLDFACRLHGDEFAVLMPCTTQAGACALGERLVERVRSAGGAVPFSVSIGVDVLRGDAPGAGSLGRLLDGADRALRAAKRAGKGRVHASGPAERATARENEAEPAPAGETEARPGPAGDDPETDLGGETPAPPALAPVAGVAEDGGRRPAEDRDASDAAGDDALAAALAEAAATLVRQEDLGNPAAFRGKALLVSSEPEVAEILTGFLRKRGLPVEVASDLASALTLLDSLEFFLVMADAAPDSVEARAFREAAHRIDPALHVFLFVGAGDADFEEGEDARVCHVRKPFLLSDLFLRASRAREDYHLRQARD